jgi:hypothetical protein
MAHRPAFSVLLVLAVFLGGCTALRNADFGDLLNPGNLPLDEGTVAAGLKEALRVGTDRSVLSTSTVDGFLGNALIRVALPEQMAPVAEKLRTFGLGSYVDELEVGMNRAAELAAGEARTVFWTAVTSLTIADAFAILEGGDTAATDLVRSRTSAELTTRFAPIVSSKMDEVGVARLYDDLSGAYDRIPLAEKPALVDLDAYVTDAALQGLFTVLGQEERKIRLDPLARTTDLLRRVFGRE